MEKIERRFRNATAISNRPLTMTLVRLGDTSKFIAAIKEVLPQVEAKEAANAPAFVKYASISDMPHMVITGPDTGFLEDIGLISYSLNAGFFGLTREERRQWLRRYMDVQSKDERLGLLRSLHESALGEPIMVPLLVAPYAALARKPWKVGLSQLYANNQLWLIQAN